MKIVKLALVVSLSPLYSSAASAATLFVNANAPGGNGSSWAQAYNDLQTALNSAQNGDQIWVAKGTYSGSFSLNHDIKLYGGFRGNESLLKQRNPQVNPTILSGDLNANDDPNSPSTLEDNASHVLIALAVSATIDGFVVQDGNASQTGDHGGGLLIQPGSDIKVNNSIFKNNIANQGGGAIYSNGSKLSVSNSLFMNNKNTNPVPGNNGGGAIYIVASPAFLVTGSEFNNNVAGEDGGAIRIDNVSGSISNSTFSNNEAGHSAGAIVINNSFGDPGLYNFTLNKIIVENNIAHSFGGAMLLNNEFGNPSNTVSIADSTFTGNRITYLNDGVFRIGGDGGAIEMTDLTTTITNTLFSDNSAVNDGGAVCAVNFFESLGGLPTRATLSITNSVFRNNMASGSAQVLVDNLGLAFGAPVTEKFGGGAIRSGVGMITTVNKCEFNNNTANGNGGAINNGDLYVIPAPGVFLVYDGTMNITNSKFINNTASKHGGSISSVAPVANQLPLNLSVNHSDLFNNKANDSGNGMYLENSVNTLIGNNIGPQDDVVTIP